MSRAFTLPDLGEGVHEAEVLAVHVDVGQQVREGDPLLEVETDKAAVEIPSPFTGTVAEVLVKEGDSARVGEVMIVFAEGKAAETPGPKTPAVSSAAPAAHAAASPPGKPSGNIPASPATRRLAREMGVDLQRVTPTGAAGLVTAEDVRAAAAGSQVAAVVETAPAPLPFEPFALPVPVLPDFSQWGEVERRPFRSIRRATARQMVTAWSQIPHVTAQDLVDITRLESFRQKHKEEIKAAGGRLTLTVFAMKAAATALKAYPMFNSSLDLVSQEIVVKKYFNIGVAVDTEDGLIVPVIRDVDRKSIRELAVELHACVQRTRSRKAALDDLLGGTFTITNAGAMGGGFFTPIINFPQVAILGFGHGRMQPAAVPMEGNGYEIAPRLLMPVVLCFDHRVVDGADSIRFMKVVIEALQDPEELLMSMI
ncbi:MAG: dihydrolipoamide acetyltransferase family protein [Desulfocapsaceae bacterium]|nr:dihydrolipoamide acetyltransferase family protein [Desulfocapsaceae bacterium]